MQKKVLFAFIIAAMVFGTRGEFLFAQRGGRSQGETLEIRIASPLPKESPWGRSLDRIAVEWARTTNNQLQLRVLHNGIEGDEERMLRSLKGNHIQAAVLTTFGLAEINPAIMTMSAPFLIRTDSELNAVMKEVEAELEAGINNDEYFLVSWSKSGYANIFSKDLVLTPDDLRKQRIASSPEATSMNTVFKTMGFQVVETALTDMGNKVASGAVQAVYITPSGAAPFQLHTQLKNMLSINIAPIMGGIVINQVTWRRIAAMNPQFQQNIVRITRQVSQELDASMPKLTSDAVNSMSRTGLSVNKPNQAQEQLWYDDLDRSLNNLLGNAYDQNLYQKIQTIVRRERGNR